MNRGATTKSPRKASETLFEGSARHWIERPGERAYAQVPTAANMLLGVRVINLGTASGGLLPIAGALKDILLVRIAAELLGTVGDVDDRGDVGDQRDDRDRGGGAGVSVEWVTKMDSSWK